MSVLGIDEVSKRIQQDKLFENLSDRELTNPEGAAIDLRLGAVYRISRGGAFINADGSAGQGARKGVKTEQLYAYQPGSDQQDSLVIEPGDYYLISTVETINTPEDLLPVVYPRSSLFRAGLQLLVTEVDPGYSGVLTFGICNLSQFPVTLQLGARICDVVFHKIEGKTAAYRGQHQGGRVSPEEVEQQV